eukprot:g77790.t1
MVRGNWERGLKGRNASLDIYGELRKFSSDICSNKIAGPEISGGLLFLGLGNSAASAVAAAITAATAFSSIADRSAALAPSPVCCSLSLHSWPGIGAASLGLWSASKLARSTRRWPQWEPPSVLVLATCTNQFPRAGNARAITSPTRMAVQRKEPALTLLSPPLPLWRSSKTPTLC